MYFFMSINIVVQNYSFPMNKSIPADYFNIIFAFSGAKKGPLPWLFRQKYVPLHSLLITISLIMNFELKSDYQPPATSRRLSHN